jgi:hypothetical protein
MERWDRVRRWATVVLTALACVACEESRVDISDFPAEVGVETRQFIVALRNAGATVEVRETAPASNSLLGAPTTHITVNGADVYVSEFATRAEADAAAARVPALLTVTTFPAAPHFFRGDRIIVLYVGNDPAIVSLLQGLLGPAFVG